MQAVIDKLSRLKQRDTSFSVFGSTSHRYLMAPPFTEAEIEGFEQKHKIRLPADYREFVKTVGSSGAGPFYGLMSLFDESESSNPSEVFPLTMGQEFRCLDAYDAIDDSLDEEEQEQMLNNIFNSVTKGYIYLAHEGCGMFSILIVNGAEAGHVWYSNLANDAGIFPLAHPETEKPLSFQDWYLLWLDAAIKMVENGDEMPQSYADFIPQSSIDELD